MDDPYNRIQLQTKLGLYIYIFIKYIILILSVTVFCTLLYSKSGLIPSGLLLIIISSWSCRKKNRRSAKPDNETDDCTASFYGKDNVPSSEGAGSTWQATSS